jgi:hypothetical protein
MLALPSSERRVPSPPRTLLLVRRSYRLIRQSLLALLSFGYSPRSRSLCRLLPAPAASGTFPTLFCESLLRCLSPCPGGPLSAFACFFLRVIGLAPQRRGRLSRFCPRTRFSTGRVSRLQLFRYVQASQLARLPDRSYRCKYFCRAAKAFYLRAERVSLPSHASDTLSARLQAIGGTRTCTSLDSQGCRLLTFAPRPLQPLPRYYWPVRHPLAFLPFPGVAGYRSDLLQRFLAGTRRASPVC